MEVTQIKEVLLAMSLLTALLTSVATVAGTWALIRYRLGAVEKRTDAIEKKSSSTGLDGNACQQVVTLRENTVSKQRFDDVLFNGAESVSGQLHDHDRRITRLETACKERHVKDVFEGARG